MDVINRLEGAVEQLLEKNRSLQEENKRLNEEKELWEKERSHLLTEVDRILKRLENI